MSKFAMRCTLSGIFGFCAAMTAIYGGAGWGWMLLIAFLCIPLMDTI